MTINSTVRKAGPYIGNGSTATFPFTFKVFEASNLLVVRLNVATQEETTLTLTSQYTVSLNPDQNSNPGGSITLVGGNLATGFNLVIGSDIPNLQNIDLTNQGGFYPDVINDALDSQVIQIQQLQEEIDRAIKVPITESVSVEELTADLIRLADSADNIDTVALNIADVVTVADNMADVNLVADNMADINTVADNIAAVNNVSSISAEIIAVDAISADITTVAGIAGDVSAVAAIDDKVVIAADNVVDITNFADVYYGPNPTDPTTRKNGDPLQKGDMYYNTTLDQLEVYNGIAFDPLPAASVARTFYVTVDGNDANSGNSLSSPLATIGQAVTNMTALAPLSCVAIVHPGTYTVQPDTVVPANCALYGYDLRVTKLQLPSNAKQNNMFQLSNGCKVRGFTFTNLQHEEPTTYLTIGAGIAGTADYDYFKVGAQLYKRIGVGAQPVSYDYPPKKGFAFVFKPGEIITRSPYIGDCSQLHYFTQEEMSLPIDREAGNPLMPRGGGNLRADGSVLSPSSPLRSVVVDSFTAINPNGNGYLVTRNALVQLVSVFTNWSRNAIWSHDGGQVTVSNSNITFGDYGLVATGTRNTILISDVEGAPIGTYTAAADLINANKQTIIDDMYTQLESEFVVVQNFTPEQEAFTKRDAATYLQELMGDLRSAQNRGAKTFAMGFFDWNGVLVFDDSLLPVFARSFQIMLDEIEALGGAVLPAMPMLNSLTDLITDTLYNPVKQPFVSVVESNGHQFSYAGSGVNYNALPLSQRGTGEAPLPETTIIQLNGGKVYATFTTEQGDSYLGSDLRVDFKRNTIEGQAFSRGVQNITLPLIIALGG